MHEACTFEPLLFTRARGAAAAARAEAKHGGDFYARLEDDVRRRQDRDAKHRAEDDHCRQWFSRNYADGLRQPHFHENGLPGARFIEAADPRDDRVLPGAKGPR